MLVIPPLLMEKMGGMKSICLSMHTCSVMLDSLQPHGLQPARLLCPCNFPGKKTGVGCHFLLQGNLLDSGIKPASFESSALAGRFFTTLPPGKHICLSREEISYDIPYIQNLKRNDTIENESCLVVSDFCDPMDYTVHGILQARILEWVAFPAAGDLPNPGIKPRSPTLQESKKK